MPAIIADTLIVGSGLGATAAARALAVAGQRVIVIPGVGRSRSPHVDGGLIDPRLLSDVFGDGAPTGRAIDCYRDLRLASRDRFQPGPVQASVPRHIYRRNTLEGWAMDQAVGEGAIFLRDFVEGKALPNSDGSMTLTSESDDRVIRAQAIALCEGADPRIPLRVGLRPDYGPADQLHFARTLFEGARAETMASGDWRTSWGMPVEFRVIPQEDGVIVAVVARIENVMRSNRSTADALEELLASPAFAGLGIEGERIDTGTELVPLRPGRRNVAFVHDRLIMGIDASGVIDPRRIDRADLTMCGGLLLAKTLLAENGSPDAWSGAAAQFVRDARPGPATYHDDQGTGFLEEGPASGRKAFAKVAGLFRRR